MGPVLSSPSGSFGIHWTDIADSRAAAKPRSRSPEGWSVVVFFSELDTFGEKNDAGGLIDDKKYGRPY